MFRASLTFLVTTVLTILFGGLTLTLGLVLPERWCFDVAFYLWSAGILAAAGVRLEVEGADRLDADRAYFFAGNHASAMDIPVLAVVTRGHSRFMAKRSLFHIPVLGWSMYMHGFVPIDRSSPRRAMYSIDAMLRRLQRRPVSMIVFPEGTRRTDGQVADFKRGAMHVCQRSGLPLVPFALHGSLGVHRAGVFRISPGRVRISLGEPIPPAQVQQLPTAILCQRVRDQVVLMYEGLRTVEAATPALAPLAGGGSS